MDSIFSKLAEFQKRCPAVAKDALNPHFKSKYADLSSIISTITPLMGELNLCIVHTIEGNQLETRVIDSDSDEFVSSILPLLKADTMQMLGSAITYAKRYNIGCLLNIQTDDDDDGQKVSQPVAKAVVKVIPKAKKTLEEMEESTGEKYDASNPQHKQLLSAAFKAAHGIVTVKGEMAEKLKMLSEGANGHVSIQDLTEFAELMKGDND